MTELTQNALARWNMQTAECSFVAGRENRVFKVNDANGTFALRVRRPGLRNQDELRSELLWLDALSAAGLSVPRPVHSTNGHLLEEVSGHFVDLVGWLEGPPLGQSRVPLAHKNSEDLFFELGRNMAHLHEVSDSFAKPEAFTRPRWDLDGLLGDSPLWDRFWKNPTLRPETEKLLLEFREHARQNLSARHEHLDFGLIHADLVRENILVQGTELALIDFDDGGYGYRLFDLATTLIKNRNEPNYELLKSALLDGYLSRRHLDLELLDLFIALRAVTYVGWIIRRIEEDGSPSRNTRFIAEAEELCASYLQHVHTP